MKNSLEYSARALEIAPEQIHFAFNIAFVQIQLAQLIYSLPETQRNLKEVQDAAEGLDNAIESFTAIAHAKNPPYPKHDIEQRANMGRNTMRRQLERAIQQQKEYEDANAAKLQEAREIREAEMKKREEERMQAEKIIQEKKRKLAEERHKMLEISRELAEKRADEERRKEEAEYTDDEETGQRVKRKKKKAGGKRKKKGEDDDGDGSGLDGPGRKSRGRSTTDGSGAHTSDEERAPKKKRKLARKTASKAEGKIKSSELVGDSDDDGEIVVGGPQAGDPSGVDGGVDAVDDVDSDTKMDDGDEEDEDAVQRPRKKISRHIAEDDDEEGDADDDVDAASPKVEDGEDESGDENGATVNGTGNVFADPEPPPMVDETVAAAGDGDTAEY